LDQLILFLTMLCVFVGLIMAAIFTAKSGSGAGSGGSGGWTSTQSDPPPLPPRIKKCERCGGTGKVQSLYIPMAKVDCNKCDGVGSYYVP
jgi:DnaJ-class molecular chaperone